MQKTIEIEPTTNEIAEALFNLDNKQVAEVFAMWKILFDEEYKRRKEAKEHIWIFDLNHFMMHVVKELDDDGKEFIRSMYSSLVYELVNNSAKKHLTDIII